MITPTSDTKIGLTYRYGITHNIVGQAQVSGLTGALAPNNGQRSATAELNLPDMFTAALSQKLTPELTLLAQVDYFTWSNFKEIRVVFPAGAPSVTPENYEDTVSPMVGLEYQMNDTLRLRTGFKFDPTPTSSTDRETRVPDGDRYWISGGFHYDFMENMGLDVGYSHIFVTESTINVTRNFYEGAPFPIPTSANIRASSSIGLDIISVGLTSHF